MDTDRRLAMIRLAAAFYRFEGHRATDIRERFDMPTNVFWQQIVDMLNDDDPAVEAAEPESVHRLRRLMGSRVAAKRAS